MTDTSNDAGVYTSGHQDGLELELTIVAALLERNRCSHGRTKYFQRLSMAHRCLKRHGIIDLYNHLQSLESELQQLKQRERKRRQREKIFWEIETSVDHETMKSLHELRSDLRARLLRVEALVTRHLFEAVSRFDYAAKALFGEIARGFFLPLNAVAVAAVARIRALLLRLATRALQTMPSLQSAYRDVFHENLNWTPDQLNTAMNKYHSMSILNPEERSLKEEFVERTLKQMGISLATMEASDSPRETDGIVSSNYATDLVDDAKVSLSTAVGCVSDTGDDLGAALADDNTETASNPTTKHPQAADQGIDMNYTLVKQMALNKKQIKRKSAQIKEKSDSEARRKKKKAKKSKKEDFFDMLFGASAK